MRACGKDKVFAINCMHSLTACVHDCAALLEIMKEASGSTLLDMSEEVWQEVWQAVGADQKALASTDAGREVRVHMRSWHAGMCMSNKTFYLWCVAHMLECSPCKFEHSTIHAQTDNVSGVSRENCPPWNM